MKFIRHDSGQSKVDLYPIGDWHYGSPQCDLKFIKKVIDIIDKNPDALWVGMGDLIENAIVGSKSDVYLQSASPSQQIEDIVKILTPIKDKCLFLMPGNHEERTMRQVGLHPGQIIASDLRVKYIGYSAVLALYLPTKSNAKLRAVCYFHHNTGGGFTAGGKVNAASRLRLIVPTADATFSGHSHTTNRSPVTWYEAGKRGLVRHTGYDYIIGSTLTYKDSYAEEKAKRPSTLEQIMVSFQFKRRVADDGVRQTILSQEYHIIDPNTT